MHKINWQSNQFLVVRGLRNYNKGLLHGYDE